MIEIEVRCLNMPLLVMASRYPSKALFRLISRLVWFQYRQAPGGRWRTTATAYDLIDWDRFDDDDFGKMIPVGIPA